MNLASWVILGVVALVVALAIRATFFKNRRKGLRFEQGDEPTACLPSACSACTCASCPSAKAHR